MTTPERNAILDAPPCRLIPEASCFRKPGARECMVCLVGKVRIAFGLPTVDSSLRVDKVMADRKGGE